MKPQKLEAKMDNIKEIKRRANQAVVNFNWILNQMEIIHDNLCPEKFGTWQDRVNQIVEESKKMAHCNIEKTNKNKNKFFN